MLHMMTEPMRNDEQQADLEGIRPELSAIFEAAGLTVSYTWESGEIGAPVEIITLRNGKQHRSPVGDEMVDDEARLFLDLHYTSRPGSIGYDLMLDEPHGMSELNGFPIEHGGWSNLRYSWLLDVLKTYAEKFAEGYDALVAWIWKTTVEAMEDACVE